MEGLLCCSPLQVTTTSLSIGHCERYFERASDSREWMCIRKKKKENERMLGREGSANFDLDIVTDRCSFEQRQTKIFNVIFSPFHNYIQVTSQQLETANVKG